MQFSVVTNGAGAVPPPSHSPREYIRSRLKSLKRTQDGLARHIRRDRAAVSRIVNGQQEIKGEQLRLMAEYLKVPVAELAAHIYGEPLPSRPGVELCVVSGYIVGDGDITATPDWNLPGALPFQQLRFVEAPAGFRGNGEVFLVLDNRRLRKYETGDLLFCRRTETDLSAVIGQECVVTLPGGRRLFRRVHLGSKPHRYVLVSREGTVETEAQLLEALPLDWIRPADAGATSLA